MSTLRREESKPPDFIWAAMNSLGQTNRSVIFSKRLRFHFVASSQATALAGNEPFMHLWDSTLHLAPL